MNAGQATLQFSVRNTQRVPRSCTRCARRKIKCTKTLPCKACISRGDALSCSCEVVRVDGNYKLATNSEITTGDTAIVGRLVSENNGLRARIQQLEYLLRRNDVKNSRAGALEVLLGTSTPTIVLEGNEPHEEIISSFERLHMTTPAEQQYHQSFIDHASLSDEILSLLPIRKSSEKIVRFSLDGLGWVHCALDAPRFMEQHEAFWNSLQANRRDILSDHAWMAVYFSVLSVGVYFMDKREVDEIHYLHEGFTSQLVPVLSSGLGQILDVCRAWYDRAMKELVHADFMSKPSLATVQTLAILAVIHRSLGEQDREYIMLGLSINVARTLGLDRLDSDYQSSAEFCSKLAWSDYEIRELGRRLWWTLVISDWMAISSRPSTITPQSFTTVLSIDENRSHRNIVLNSGINNSNSIHVAPSPLEYHLALAKLSQIVHTYVKFTNGKSTASVYKALKEIERIERELPPHLAVGQHEYQFQEAFSLPWIAVQRNQLRMLLEVWRINLCISFLPRLYQAGKDEFDLPGCGLRAAVHIVQVRHSDPSSSFRKFWGIVAATLTAGIFLALDLICFKGSKDAANINHQLDMIEFCACIIQDSTERGSDILRRLVYVSNQWIDGVPINRQTLAYVMKLVALPQDSNSNYQSMLPIQADWELKFKQLMRSQNIGSMGYTSLDDQEVDLGLFEYESGADLDLINFNQAQIFEDGNLDWETLINFNTFSREQS